MDPYEALGVKRSANVSELRRAYQRLARQWHPALNPLDPVAAERFRVAAEAFRLLSDPETRARVDRGERAEPAPVSEPQVAFQGFDFSVEVRRSSAGFREIFDGLIPGAAPERESTPGEDLQQTTRIDFEESLHGARRRVQVVRFDSCAVCEGTGETSLGPVACPKCKGLGQLRSRRGHMVFTRTCGDCVGRGTLLRPCARCAGEGRVMQSEWIDVAIPAGVADGSQVRVPGAGNAGRRGARPGDFVLGIEVLPHPFFKRDGDDLWCEVPISLAEATLGAHVEVPTPEDPVTIEIPAGSQTGQRFRLRKRGMPRPGEKGRGDLFVEVRVAVPTVTEARGRELVEELARLHPGDPRAEIRRLLNPTVTKVS